MIDSSTHQTVKVQTEGNAGPYIAVDLQDLERVQALLRQHQQSFATDREAISVSGEPATAIINLGRSANVQVIQQLLDMTE